MGVGERKGCQQFHPEPKLKWVFDPSQDTRRQDDGVDDDVADAITNCLNDLIGCILNPIAENPGNPALLAAISATTFVGGIAGARMKEEDDMKEKDKKDKA